MGLEQITTGFFGLALWGNDSFTTEADGLSTGAVPQFAILFDGNVIPFNESPEFTGFETNGIFFVTDTDLQCINSETYYNCDGTCINDSDADGVCNELEVLGCTDPSALNHNPNATDDNGSCGYGGATCQINWPSELLNLEENATYVIESVLYEGNPSIYTKIGAFFTNDQGELQCGGWNNWTDQLQTVAVWEDDELTDEKDGFYEGEVITWFATNDGGLSTQQVSIDYIDSDDNTAEEASLFTANSINVISSFNILNVSDCDIIILGCTDSNALNYNPISTLDDGTCIAITVGCTNPNAENYDELANIDNGTCIIYGCTDELFAEYNPDANFDDGSCNNTAFYGCTYEGAINFNPEANIDDDSCIFLEDIIDTSMFNNPVITGVNMTIGFNDTLLNQFENGQIGAFFDLEDDGDLQCVGLVYIQDGFFSMAIWGDDVLTTEQDGLLSGDIPEFAILYEGNVISFNDFEEFNGYNSNEVVIINEIYLNNFLISGCINQTAFNYNPYATVDDGSCVPFIFGCTDEYACEYNPTANSDDGSCTQADTFYDCSGFCLNDTDGDEVCDEIEVAGCTDSNANNYNNSASDDDGSCQYSNNLFPIEDPYFLNYLQNNYPDIIVNDSLDINATAGIDTLDLPFMSYFTNIDPVQFFNDLTYLSCWGQDLTSLPELPDGLKVLLCASNELTSLPELPAGLTWLSCGLNQLTNLPDLPDELVILSCNQNNLTSLPVLPQNLSTITFFENPLECVSNYLPQFQELNAYPLCEQSFSFCEQDQWLLPFEGNTGSNMTLLLQESFVSSLNIQTNNAYIVATTETGLIVGSSYLNNTQTSLAVWGDDSFTSEIDGATDGQLINLHLIDSNLLYDVNTSLNYVTNNLDVITNEVSPILTCTAENLGCTDESACNYNAEAIIEDGSCNYSETYFDCNGNCINDSDADGICDEQEVAGCTNPNASNYNNIATDDDGTCIILGCTDQEACNWNSEANTDDESCFYAETYYNCDGSCINDFDLDGECDEIDYDDDIGINEVECESAQLIKMIDVLGREYKEHKKGMLLFYIYQNGKVEKRVIH